VKTHVQTGISARYRSYR